MNREDTVNYRILFLQQGFVQKRKKEGTMHNVKHLLFTYTKHLSDKENLKMFRNSYNRS